MFENEATYRNNPTKLLEKESFLSNHAYLSGQALPNEEDARVLSLIIETPDRQKYPNLFYWWWSMVPFSEPARELWRNKKKDESQEEEAIEELTRHTSANSKSDPYSWQFAKIAVEISKLGASPDNLLDLGRKLIKTIKDDGIAWSKEMSVKENVDKNSKLIITGEIDSKKIYYDDVRELIKTNFGDTFNFEIIKT